MEKIQENVYVSLREENEERSCLRKKAYTTEALAQQQVDEALRHGERLHVYRCRYHDHFHIGHRIKNISRLKEEHVLCPKGCTRLIRVSKLQKHLLKCPGRVV